MGNIVGVCIIGAGRAGMIHAQNFKKSIPFAELIAVVDPNETAAREAASYLELDKYYIDYKQALEDEAIHAVVVVTPTIYHREIVVAAAKAGKHILCEKPMAINETECDEMIAAAEQANVKLQIAFMRRFDQSFLQAKEEIEAGEIGDIVLVKSLTRGPSVPQPWMYDLKKSNGPLAEVNSHDIDTLRWFTGAEFETVYAIAGNYRSEAAREEFPDFYDNVVLMAKFANQCQGVIDGAVAVNYGYDARVEILGTAGIILIGQQHEKTITIGSKKRGLSKPIMNSWRSLHKDAYHSEASHFIQCIIEDQKPSVTGFDGKMAVKVVNAGNQSIKESKIIRL